MFIPAQLGHFLNVKWDTHIFNLALQHALKSCTATRRLRRVRWISGFFHHSTIAKRQHEEHNKLPDLPSLKLKTVNSSRWNSAREIGGRFLEQSSGPVICTTLLTFQQEEESQWNGRLEQVVIKTLKPMKDTTALMVEESSPTIFIWLLCTSNSLMRQRTALESHHSSRR